MMTPFRSTHALIAHGLIAAAGFATGCESNGGSDVAAVNDRDTSVPMPDVEVFADAADVADEAVAEVAPPDVPGLLGACDEAPMTSCDGQDGCFRWRLKGIEIPPTEGDAHITWEVEAHCAEPLDEVLFAFEPGIERLAPAPGTVYTSPNGSTWLASAADDGCAGFRLTRQGEPDADGKTTFLLSAVPASIDPTTVFVNRARAGATSGGFATRASTCFVFTP